MSPPPLNPIRLHAAVRAEISRGHEPRIGSGPEVQEDETRSKNHHPPTHEESGQGNIGFCAGPELEIDPQDLVQPVGDSPCSQFDPCHQQGDGHYFEHAFQRRS